MRVAVYAGTFDPVTNGHWSVIERAARIFDRLFVVVAVNPAKRPLFSLEERVEMIREQLGELPQVECESTEDLVVHFARRVGAGYLVRGVRSSTDVESEIELAELNHALAPDVTTVFIPAEPGLSELSSSRIKELVRAGQDVSRYCAPGVSRKLEERLRSTLPEEGRDAVA